MAVKDRNVLPSANFAISRLVVPVVTAISQTSVVAFTYTPGFAFQIVRVRSYNKAKAGAVAGVLKVSTRSAVAAVTFTTATEVAQTLSTTLANVQGSATDAITLEYTSDGSGVLTNGGIVVEIRPQHMNGEA